MNSVTQLRVIQSVFSFIISHAGHRLRNVALAGIGITAAVAQLSSAAADYSSEVLADGPIAYYRLSENVPTPLYDYGTNSGTAGSAADGQVFGLTHGATGIPGAGANAAMTDPGGGGRMSVSYSATLNQWGSFTAEFWTKPAGGSSCPYNSIDFGAAVRTGWLIYQDTIVAGQWTFRVYKTGGANVQISGGTVTQGVWHHVVGVFDSVTTNLSLYVDGVLAAGPTALSGDFTPMANPVIPLNIGVRSDTGFPYTGDFDEAAFYTNVLTGAQILAHYQAGTNSSTPNYAGQVLALNPAGYWRLGEAVPAYPAATNTGSLGVIANGAYQNGVTNIAGPSSPAFPGFGVNRAASFDGTSAAIQIPNTPAMNLSNQFSVIAWVNCASISGGLRDIFAHGYSTSPNGEILLRRNGAVYNFGSWDGADHSTSVTIDPGDVGNWVMLAGTSDGSQVRFYHNGDKQAEVSDSVAAVPVNLGWAIGSRGGIGERYWDGGIDEVALFNKALTAGRIISLYFTAIGSNSAPFMVSDPPTLNPPGIIYATTPFSMTADVAGSLPMTFQWKHEGTNLLGATSATFTKANASVSDGGNYVLWATNALGFTNSQAVAVTINPAVPPTITSQPQSRLVYTGGSASFTVGADGTQPFTYQWKHAGTNLPGSTNATLIVTNCSTPQTGTYTVGVSNVAGGLVSAAATLSLITPQVGSFEEAIITNGALAYWRLNETASSIASDDLGGHDGIVAGGVTQADPGPASPAYPGFPAGNTSYAFDGLNGTVMIGNPSDLNFTGRLSVVVWVKPASASAGLHNIFMHGYSLSPNGETGFRRTGSTYEFLSWDGNNHIVSAPVPDSDIGNWALLVGTYDGTAFRLYHNGELAGTQVDPVGAVTVNSGWAIGSRGTGTERFFDGNIDEVALYNKALSANAVTALYATAKYGTTTPPLVTRNPASRAASVGNNAVLTAGIAGSLPLTYQWKKNGVNIPGATSQTLTLSNVFFTDTASYVLYGTNSLGFTNTTTAVLTVLAPPAYANQTNGLVLHLKFDGNYLDTSGRANNASAPNGSPGFIAGKLGSGVNINTSPGANYLSVPDINGDFVFDVTNSFTVALWLRYTAGFNDVPIIGNAINSTYQPGWVLTEEGGRFEWTAVSGGSIIADPVSVTSPLINNGNWHHVAVAFDRAAGSAASYVDGVPVAAHVLAGLGSLDFGQPVTIGQDPSGSYGTANFDLDDVGIWRRALTDYEMLSVYNAAQNGISFDAIGPVKVYVRQVGASLYVYWQSGTLLQANSVTGPYTPVPGASPPFYFTTPSASARFYRVQQ